MEEKIELIPLESVQQSILALRGQRVILDRDLAALYGVPTKALKQAVRRNLGRFPEDFMFELTQLEFSVWRSQFVTSKADRKGLRYPPMAFTEQGVAMLSSVLGSERAIQVNIAVMRAFVRLRQVIATHRQLADKLAELEKKIGTTDQQIAAVFEALRRLMAPSERVKKEIGFKVKEKSAAYKIAKGKRL